MAEQRLSVFRRNVGFVKNCCVILAAPMVIKNGIKIFYEENHKGRGFSCITFGAPITIDGKRGNMAVVIIETDKNRYSAHRVLLPDGTMFVLDKEIDTASANVGSIAEKSSNPRPTITSVSKKSVPQASPKSNSELEIQGSKSKDDGFYYDEDEVFEQALWDDAYNAKFDELVKGESDEVNPDDLFGRTYNVMIYVAKTAQRVFPKEDVHRIRQSKNAFGRFLFLLKE